VSTPPPGSNGGIVAANVLTGEAGLFIGIIALALWLLKVTVSTYWLTVIGEIARAITGAVIQVATSLGLLLIAVPIGVFVGAVTVKRGEAGRGWTMIGIALTMPALSIAIFTDPAGLMYGTDGLLAFGRRVGFSVASAATHNGALAGSGAAEQVDSLTASLITHTVREPMQLWNFGHVVDRVGGCGGAWSAAVRGGAADGPIKAMGACGDRAAVLYAQHLDATNIWVGFVFVAAASLLAFFMVVSGWMVLRVSVKAIWTTVILLPTLWLGAIPGAPQRRAVDVVWQFFSHAIEVLVYIVYVSVVGLAVERIVSAPLPADLGGTNPFAHVLMMGGVALAALLLLRHVRSDLSGRPSGEGLFRRAGSVAVGMGISAVVGGAGTAAVQGVRGMRRGSGPQAEQAPWEQMGAEAGLVHGGPQAGFDAVPGMSAARSEVRPERPEGTSYGRNTLQSSDPGGQSSASGDVLPSRRVGEAAAVPATLDTGAAEIDTGREGDSQVMDRAHPSLSKLPSDEEAFSVRAITDAGQRHSATPPDNRRVEQDPAQPNGGEPSEPPFVELDPEA
jgi:hypothetical protein